MSSELKPHPLTENLVRAALVSEPSAAAVEQWVYWNNSPSRHGSLDLLTKFLPESFFRLLLEDHRVRSHVDRLLKLKFAWKNSVAWTPDDLLCEVSLIEPQKMKRLSLFAAALSLRKSIAQIIDGSIVRKLRQEIGGDIIEFALMSGSSSRHPLNLVTSEATISTDLVDAIKKEAIIIVQNAFSSKARGVQERIASKLPGCFAEQFCDVPLPVAEVAEKFLNQLWKEASSWL